MRDALTIERDDQAGTLLVCAGKRTVIGWQFHEQFALPHWYPLTSVSGENMLVQHPDPYPHHRAMWIADRVQLENGPIVDFYHCWKNLRDAKRPEAGHQHFQKQMEITRCSAQGNRAEVACALHWLVDGKTPTLLDQRQFVVQLLPTGEALIDLQWSLRAAFGAVHFHSDWVHYAWPYLRMQPAFTPSAGGALFDDVGRVAQAATSGNYCNWIAYLRTSGEQHEGVAVMVPQDGAWRKWLTRDYGTFGPRRPDARSGGKFTLAQGEELTGQVRLYVFAGDRARIAKQYRRYVNEARK